MDASGRSEAGGLQYTAQQLGSALGVALIGAVVLTGLVNTFVREVDAHPEISADTSAQVEVAVQGGVSFVPADAVQAGAEEAGVAPSEVDAVVSSYEEAQLRSLKAGLLLAGLIALGALALTRDLPSEAPDPTKAEVGAAAP